MIDFEFINDTQLNVTEGEGFQVCIALEGSVNLTELISMGNLGFSLNFVVSPRTASKLKSDSWPEFVITYIITCMYSRNMQ